MEDSNQNILGTRAKEKAKNTVQGPVFDLQASLVQKLVTRPALLAIPQAHAVWFDWSMNLWVMMMRCQSTSPSVMTLGFDWSVN